MQKQAAFSMVWSVQDHGISTATAKSNIITLSYRPMIYHILVIKVIQTSAGDKWI